MRNFFKYKFIKTANSIYFYFATAAAESRFIISPNELHIKKRHKHTDEKILCFCRGKKFLLKYSEFKREAPWQGRALCRVRSTEKNLNYRKPLFVVFVRLEASFAEFPKRHPGEDMYAINFSFDGTFIIGSHKFRCSSFYYMTKSEF